MKRIKKLLCMLTAMTCAVGMFAVQPKCSEVSAVENSDFKYTGTLPTGGDKFTVLSWNASFEPTVKKWASDMGYSESQINYINLNTYGGGALDYYYRFFMSGEDIDVLLVEQDWALELMNKSYCASPLSALGFTDSDFSEQYSFTKDIGKNSKGVLKGVAWQVSSGAWCYRADLAEQYLGVKTPEEMQAKVSDWDKFQSTAGEVYSASEGQTALTTTLYGMYNAYKYSRTKPWVVDNNLVTDNFCYDFISLAKNMTDNSYVTDINQWTDTWYKAGQTDSTMGYFVSSWGFGESILLSAAGGESGATFGKWKACQGPSPYNWGGTWLCVYPRTDNADMAASLINYIAVDKESMRSLAESESDYLPNNMALTEELISEGKNSSGLLGGQDYFKPLHENAKALDMSGIIAPYDSSVDMYFLKAVNSYCKGEMESVEECIESFENDVYANVEFDFTVTDDPVIDEPATEPTTEPTTEPATELKGDITGNNKIDLYDAIEVCRYIMGMRTFTDAQRDIADYNRDGKVDLYDAIGIAKKLLEK